MNQDRDSGIKDLYVVFSKGFFVPEVLEGGFACLSEPFRSSLKSFQKAFHKNSDDLHDYLDSGVTPFWGHELFIPNLGRITYNHRKNVTSRLLLGNGGWRSKFSYSSSTEFSEILHLPLLIEFKKRIRVQPAANEYFNKLRQDNSLGQPHRSYKKVGASQQNRVYIHFYPYGLYFIHLSISITSTDSINIDELIKWLRALKVQSKNHGHDQVLLTVSRKFQGSLDDFFEYLWSLISKSVLENKNPSVQCTPIYDSIRIKPASSIRIEAIDKISQKKPSKGAKYADLQDALCAQNRCMDIIDRLQYQVRLPDDIETFSRNIDLESFIRRADYLGLDGQWNFSELSDYINELIDSGDIANLSDMVWTIYWIQAKYAKELYQEILKTLRKRFPIKLSSREVAGLLSKSPNWRDNRVKKEDYQSVFGRHKRDLILPKSQSTLIVTNVWSKGLKFQLLFHWQLLAVCEIAYAQKLITSYYIDRLKKTLKSAKESNESAEIKTSTLSFLHGLINLPIHLAPKFRKWYYQVSEATGLPRRQQELRRVLESYEERIHLEQTLQENIERFDQTRTIVDLREAIIRQIQIGDDNTMIIEKGRES